jgi:hypothetical protein
VRPWLRSPAPKRRDPGANAHGAPSLWRGAFSQLETPAVDVVMGRATEARHQPRHTVAPPSPKMRKILIMSQKLPPAPCITSASAAGGGRKPTARSHDTSGAAAHSSLGRGVQGSPAVSSPACAMLHDQREMSPILAPPRGAGRPGYGTDEATRGSPGGGHEYLCGQSVL